MRWADALSVADLFTVAVADTHTDPLPFAEPLSVVLAEPVSTASTFGPDRRGTPAAIRSAASPTSASTR
ncbi:hypothetical protein ABIF97_004850 [Bradyrhizobium japonicum]